MFFGPAVNAAYTLESTVAVHPRIIIEPIVAQAVIDNIKQVKYNLVPESLQGVLRIGAAVEMRMPETGEGIVEKDIDGQYVFNYLHFPENNFPLLGCYSSCKAFLEEQIHYIYTQINENIEYRVLDKYFYLLRFFENKLNNLLEISLP